MATAGPATIEVDTKITGHLLRLRALELAVESRGTRWTDAGVVQTAEAYHAFLARKGDA